MSDNIFDSDCDAIVNTINCVGVMGGGLAAQFRQRFPEMNEAYEIQCGEGIIRPGRMWVWHGGGDHDKYLVNFPTKDHWKDPSKLEYIEDGLRDLRHALHVLGIKSIAIPPLGCGLGGLKWDDVEPLIKQYLAGVPVRVDIYPPDGPKYTL